MAQSHQHHHQHHHNHHHHHDNKSQNYHGIFILSIFLNFLFVIIELYYGYISNSLALISDAGHNLSDVLGLGLAFLANLLLQKKSSQKFTYGFRSSTILAALANSLFLLVTSLGIIYHAILRLQNPTLIDSTLVINVSAIGIFINLFTALLFFKGRKNDLNIRGAFLHLLSDALVSVGVVVSGLLIKYTQLLWIDSGVSFVVALVILLSTWQILRDSLHLVLDAVPTSIHIGDVEKLLLSQKGVDKIHHLHIWSLSTTETALTCHLVMADGHPGDVFLMELNLQLVEKFKITHSTFQIETGLATDCQTSSCD